MFGVVLTFPLAVIVTAKELGIAVVGYSPLGKGFLTGQIKSRDDLPEGDLRLHFDRFTEEVRGSPLIHIQWTKLSAGIPAQLQDR